MTKDQNILLPLSLLEAISRYYEFPVAVYFLPKKEWEKKGDTTRLKELIKESNILAEVRAIVEDL